MNVGYAVERLLEDPTKNRCTVIEGSDRTVVVTRRRFKGVSGHVSRQEFIVTVGKPNFVNRARIKKAQSFPMVIVK